MYLHPFVVWSIWWYTPRKPNQMVRWLVHQLGGQTLPRRSSRALGKTELLRKLIGKVKRSLIIQCVNHKTTLLCSRCASSNTWSLKWDFFFLWRASLCCHFLAILSSFLVFIILFRENILLDQKRESNLEIVFYKLFECKL